MKFNVDDLIEKGLVHKKTYTDGPYAGLSVLKYKNNVFWDNLWHTDERLLQCRGLVVDSEDHVVVWPFTKIFNRFENNTDLSPDMEYQCVRKVNGFMAAATIYNGDLLVSTTGSLDSEFATLARKFLDKEQFGMVAIPENWTFLFEICDPSDPHIVDEEPGAYLIGCRDMYEGDMLQEHVLDRLAEHCGWKRPSSEVTTFREITEMAKTCQHEGFVVRDVNTGELLLKIKSPHYLAKKFLMRGSDKKWEMVWSNPATAKQRVDEEFYPLLDRIRWSFEKQEWAALNAEARKVFIEDYFGENTP